MNISPIRAFSDNYIWALEANQHVWVVDPGSAEAVEQFLSKHGFTLQGILITHHHADHTGGIEALCQHRDIVVAGPANCRAKGITLPLTENDTIEVLGSHFSCLTVPGHTLDHIAYYSQVDNILFCGDTLFAGGCGRIFEGDADMMWHSLNKLMALPTDTKVFAAHEYTQNNLNFAIVVDPENPELLQRIKDVKALREVDMPTLPTTIGLELATNPFLRASLPALKQAAEKACMKQVNSSNEVFRELRAYKDRF